MTRVAVVEVYEDNLPSLHLLLVEVCLCVCLALCDTFMRLCTRSENSSARNPPSSLPCPESCGVWKAHSPEDSASSFSARAPIAARDIGSRCGMWEVVLILVLFLTFLGPLRERRQYPRCKQGSFFCITSVPPAQSNGRTVSTAALLPGAAWRNALLHAELRLEDTRPRASGAACYV